MPLAAGERLGLYEIVAPLGAGGMGEVYRARDAKLGREVAIKVLPEDVREHPERLARFEREAKLLAGLNHAGIATLHGLEEAEGAPFLVMELVEGETLADRISRGPVPVEEALPLALQIAEALEAAHEKGVIHRDLKPANIKVDPEGHVKLLDFGLAKALADEEPDSDLSQSPTLSHHTTRAGIILGTAAYMSPEQAKGKAVDKRSDIFSFGVVLFEMLTGRKAFAGEDVSEVLAAIIRAEPDWSQIPSGLDPRLGSLLRRCLRKDRKARLRDAGDVRNEIQEILADPAGGIAAAGAVAPDRSALGRVTAIAVLAGVIVGCIATWIAMRPQPSAPRPLTRFAVPLPPSEVLNLSAIALSPDGRGLVYVATRDGVRQLYRRSMGELEAAPIRGTEGAEYPFFSPDGEWVGFFADEELRKVPIDGGPPVTLCEVGYRRGASWGPGDLIVFSSRLSPGLKRVSAAGGAPEPLTTPDDETVTHSWPHLLPGGAAVLFTLFRGQGVSDEVAIHSLETGEAKVLVEGSDARYVATGHLVFARKDSSSLWVAPFDSERLELTGEARPILEDVTVNVGGLANFALAGDGSLAYAPAEGFLPGTFSWVDRDGREVPAAAAPQGYREFALSPDGSRIAVHLNEDVWIHDLQQGTWTRLTFGSADEAYPVWTPDGRRIAYGGRSVPISWKAADGSGEAEVLLENPRLRVPRAFSPDGAVLVFEDGGPGSNVGVVSLEGESDPNVLLGSEFEETNPSLSPDGRWMAYQSSESGRHEIYVRPFPDVSSGKRQVSTDGGYWPVWSPDGKELFYVGPEAMVGVGIETEPVLALGRREVLFDTTSYLTPFSGSPPSRRVAISPDGRFLLLKPSEPSGAAGSQSIVIVQNWTDELERLVPTN